jgi:hypothetical protein
MADLLVFGQNRAFNTNSAASPGAKAFFYVSGTTTLKPVYADEAATIPHPSPLVADAEGVFPPIYANGTAKVLVTDADDVPLTGFPIDPAVMVSPGGTAAASITFNATQEIPETDVQAAIERVQVNLVAPLAGLGLGVTGNAAVIANINATDTASGFYRFNSTTTGTFPGGVAASDNGIVALWRETSGEAQMAIMTRTLQGMYRRTLTGSSWGAWAYMPSSNDNDVPRGSRVIPGSANLNSYTTPGFYHQPSNANAASGSNYPVSGAGALTVVTTIGASNRVSQVYNQYYKSGEGGPRMFLRAQELDGSWSSWEELLSSRSLMTFLAGNIGGLGMPQFLRRSAANASIVYNTTYSGADLRRTGVQMDTGGSDVWWDQSGGIAPAGSFTALGAVGARSGWHSATLFLRTV